MRVEYNAEYLIVTLYFKMSLFHSAVSSATITVEEEAQESHCTGLKSADKTRTLESKYSSSTLNKDMPVFLSKPSPAAVAVGQTAGFSVKVSAFPEPTVQWFHNGQTISASSTYSLVHERDEYSLIIHRVQRDVEGEYSCTVSNRFGQSTCTSYLHVQVKEAEREEKPGGVAPDFIKAIQRCQLFEGAKGVFRYVVTGDPLPEIQWLKGNCHIQPSGLCVIVNNPDGSGFIHFKCVKQEDSGVYTCKASNPYGEASCTAELLVLKQSVQGENTSVKKTKALKMPLMEQGTWSSVFQERARSDQMIYTISSEHRQIIPSEEVGTLRELDVSAATIHREQLAQQAAVLQSHEIQERVSLGPGHPAQVSAAPGKQLHLATFLSSVQERQKITEQHSECILSPEVIDLELATEQPPKLMSVTSEEVLTLSTVRAEALPHQAPEKARSLTEPRQPVGGPQVEAAVAICDEMSDIMHRAEEEKSFRVTEGVKILYSAQSTETLPLTEGHSVTLPCLDAAMKPVTEKEPCKPVVATVSEARVTLFKEQTLEIPRAEQESLTPSKDAVCMSALTAEVKYQLHGEQTCHVAAVPSSVCVQPQREQERVLNLQVISDQDVLQSEGLFSSETHSTERAEVRKSPTVLHSLAQQEQMAVVCEGASDFEANMSAVSIHPRKELPQATFLQSIHITSPLAKEGIISIDTPEQQVAAQRKEKARRHAATAEESREITADYHTELRASVTGLEPQLRTEPTPLNILSVSSRPTQLPKEAPCVSDITQQRALVRKEDFWNTMHATNVTDTRALEEGHTADIETDSKVKARRSVEPKLPIKPVYIEETAIATESCDMLEAAEQDFAVQIQEGQSVRRSVVLEDKLILMGERSSEAHKGEGSAVSVITQPKGVLLVHECQDTPTLSKELSFSIHMPKASGLSIRQQLRDALQSAVATDQAMLLADAVGNFEAVSVQEVRVEREHRHATYCYVITTPTAPLEITLRLEGVYPQIADLRSELQVALHAIVCQEQPWLTSVQAATMHSDEPQKVLVSSVPSKELLSSVVDTVVLAESTAGFCSAESHSAVVKTETSATVERHSESHGPRQVSRKPLSEAAVLSESSDRLLESPVVTDALEDVCIEENGKATLAATIKYANKVTWFFNGQLVKSGLMPSKHHDTYTLVIEKVVKEKHQGEYVCEAENEAGKTTTSSRLSVISRGLTMGTFFISPSTNFTHW